MKTYSKIALISALQQSSDALVSNIPRARIQTQRCMSMSPSDRQSPMTDSYVGRSEDTMRSGPSYAVCKH